MKKNNRTCCVCKTEYSYCSHGCLEDRNKPEWMASFCSENCKSIYEASAGYYAKHLDANEAKTILNMCDLSKKDCYSESTRELIDEILGVEIVEVKEPIHMEESTAAEIADPVEEKVEVVEEQQEVKKEENKYYNNKSFKKKNRR